MGGYPHPVALLGRGPRVLACVGLVCAEVAITKPAMSLLAKWDQRTKAENVQPHDCGLGQGAGAKAGDADSGPLRMFINMD